VVPFEIDGIKSGKETRGHRFMAPKPFSVRSFDDYVQRLRKAFVILDGREREAIILKGAQKLAAKQQLVLIDDMALLAENAGLTEWPVVLMGSFDESFLSVPAEVLSTAMKAHQKCFSLRRGEHLANRFIMVANLAAKDRGRAIVAGNERVIAARLADAKFFFDHDRKVMLEERVPKLREIVFHEKLGTQYERVQRVRVLAREIAKLVRADPDLAERAAILAKADLVSDLVGEFPELQGVMGRYYALDQEEDSLVANAIGAHYKPVGPSDDVPRDPIAIAVALADKLDMLTGFWAIDEKPTGSKDPYALRRAALGIIRIVLENDLRIHLRPTVERHLLSWLQQVDVFEINQAFVAYDRSEANEDLLRLALATRACGAASKIIAPTPERLREIQRLNPKRFDPQSPREDWIIRVDDFTKWHGTVEELRAGVRDREILSDINVLGRPLAEWAAAVRDSLLAFFADRLKVHLRDQGARHDLVDAVFALGGDDLLTIVRRAEALGLFLDTEDGEHLLTGTKRAINILRIEEKKDSCSYDQPPDAKLLKQTEEIALAKVVDEVERDAAAAVAKEDFEAAMTAMAKLRAPVDAFFDHVTVNTDDPAPRENRLRLLSRIRATTLTVADFSKIEG